MLMQGPQKTLHQGLITGIALKNQQDVQLFTKVIAWEKGQSKQNWLDCSFPYSKGDWEIKQHRHYEKESQEERKLEKPRSLNDGGFSRKWREEQTYYALFYMWSNCISVEFPSPSLLLVPNQSNSFVSFPDSQVSDSKNALTHQCVRKSLGMGLASIHVGDGAGITSTVLSTEFV